jgi:UDP-glucose 4-epimerase
VKYLVTGGAGFIGSHIAERLLECGHDVVLYDNLFSGKQANVDELAGLPGVDESRVRFVHADILDGAQLADALAGCSAVFHQAAIASVPRSFADPTASLRANVEGTAQVLESCRAAGVNTVVMASSSSLYGDTPTLPKHEDMPLTPLSPYALSKAVDEQLLAIWTRTYGMRTFGLRYFNIFGPRQDPGSDYAAVIPKFATLMLAGKPPTIYGDGQQSRDFTYIDNAVAANFLAAGLDPDTGEAVTASSEPCTAAVNIGVGERYTLLDLVSALNDILGTDFEPNFEDPRIGDVKDSAAIDAARDAIGYRPRVDFRTGLERTVEWFAARQAGTEAG